MNTNYNNNINIKKKVVFIMGATGTGKTKLSIDLAMRFSGEVVNSDKIQAYRGLDVATNKITDEERRGVPHYLIGFLDPEEDFTVHDFCHHALMAVNQIIANGHLPIVVGGSNNYIKALVEDPRIKFRASFECCFLWMDVSLPVLYRYVGRRVDQMVEEGLVEEVRAMFAPEADYSRGIRRAIGAPEMDLYFRVEEKIPDGGIKRMFLNAAIDEIKENTCMLVNCQLGKIQRLRSQLRWEMHRIDATCVFEKYNKLEVEDAWENKVLKPSLGIVNEFLNKNNSNNKVIIGEDQTQFSASKITQFPKELSVAN